MNPVHEHKGQRPETQKCSRLQKRNQLPKPPIIDGKITLDQYFNGQNFKAVDIIEENWNNNIDSEIKTLDQTKTNFRISQISGTNKIANQSIKHVNENLATQKIDKIIMDASKLPPQKHLKQLSPSNITRTKFFNNNNNNIPVFQLEKTMKNSPHATKQFGEPIKLEDNKYLNMRQQIKERFENEAEISLLQKYGSKFNILLPQQNFPQQSLKQNLSPFRRTKYQLKELYSKLK